MSDHSDLLPRLEWWPDYGGDLFTLREGAGGVRVSIDELGLSIDLTAAVRYWLATYDDLRLPIDGTGDQEWIAEGVRLLAAARRETQGRYLIVVTELWWGEPATE